ncbi:MAG TPA: alkyl sulfatase dimerization domain-containing protein, partial [Acidimicrobiales bacterium]|nr:alkyl sulfatase dimerization domain-containing protein [Acidimicrobiales bacterium]
AASSPEERSHPLHAYGVIEEVTDGVASVSSFANVAVIDSGDGLVLVDTGGPVGTQVRDLVRSWRTDPVTDAVYTHGHIDHVMGTEVFDAEADEAGLPRPRVIAHEAIEPRFARYCLTAGYNASINRRQFSNPDLNWPTEYRHPDDTYGERFDARVGDVTLQLHHARGETDDHTWVWVPERRTLCAGDLFIWCVPNAGNPQKVQRFARDWAVALRTMAALSPEVLLPGHGLPIVGAASVRAALVDTADLLDSLVDQTLELMNAGAMLDEVLHTVTVPEHLTTQPYLQPVYDEPEFVVRNIWRLYGGWYDGNPARLKPAPDVAVATELAALAGGAWVLAERAQALAADGDVRLAGHLIELAGLAAPRDAAVHRARAELLQARAKTETSLMAKAIYGAAARDSAAVASKDAAGSEDTSG